MGMVGFGVEVQVRPGAGICWCVGLELESE